MVTVFPVSRLGRRLFEKCGHASWPGMAAFGPHGRAGWRTETDAGPAWRGRRHGDLVLLPFATCGLAGTLLRGLARPLPGSLARPLPGGLGAPFFTALRAPFLAALRAPFLAAFLATFFAAFLAGFFAAGLAGAAGAGLAGIAGSGVVLHGNVVSLLIGLLLRMDR